MPQEQRFRIEEIMAEKAKRQYKSLEKEFIVVLSLFIEKFPLFISHFIASTPTPVSLTTTFIFPCLLF